MDDRTKTDPTKAWPETRPGQTPLDPAPPRRWGRRLGVFLVLLLVAGVAWWIYQRPDRARRLPGRPDRQQGRPAGRDRFAALPARARPGRRLAQARPGAA